jgi:hypothetical protein
LAGARSSSVWRPEIGKPGVGVKIHPMPSFSPPLLVRSQHWLILSRNDASGHFAFEFHEVALCRVSAGLVAEASELPTELCAADFAVEFFECHPGKLNVVPRNGIFTHLLHQALGCGDRVANFVSDRCRKVFERSRIGAFCDVKFFRTLLDVSVHLVGDPTVAQPGYSQRRHVVKCEANAQDNTTMIVARCNGNLNTGLQI